MCVPTKEFTKQYKYHLSGFRQWDQKSHADQWLLFPGNLGTKLSIDEVAVSNGELYTILTNKAAKGGAGALVAIVAGTRSSVIVPLLCRIPLANRLKVKEITLDMSPSMRAIATSTFPNAVRVIDRFHVQQLVSEAAQEIRIGLRREALEAENNAIIAARNTGQPYAPTTYANGDTKKQLLARSRHLLFKPNSRWTDSQKGRAEILFAVFPSIHKAYKLAMQFRACFEYNYSINDARDKLANWYHQIAKENLKPFLAAAESIRLHEQTILNYFINRSTNASAESFNAKLKGFRALVRGVTDKKFFLFRVSRLYS